MSLLKKKVQNQIKMLPILAESKGGVRKKNYFETIIYTFEREKGWGGKECAWPTAQSQFLWKISWLAVHTKGQNIKFEQIPNSSKPFFPHFITWTQNLVAKFALKKFQHISSDAPPSQTSSFVSLVLNHILKFVAIYNCC